MLQCWLNILIYSKILEMDLHVDMCEALLFCSPAPASKQLVFRWSASAQTQISTRITFSFSLSFSMGAEEEGGGVTMVTNDKCQPAGKRTQRSYVSELHVCLIHRKHVSSRPEIHNHTEIHNTYASRLYNSHFKSHAQPTDLWMQECKYKPWMQY